MGLLGRARTLNILLAGTLFFAISSCDESLPPRVDPPIVLVPSLEMIGAPLIIVRDSIPVGTMGAFESHVLNVYDEVLQDSVRIRLSLEVSLRELDRAGLGHAAEHKATILGAEESLVNSNLLRGGFLTVGIDTAVIIRTFWNHRTDDGTPFWSLVPLFRGSTPGGEPFCESDTVTLIVRGSVQIFNIVQPQPFPEMHIRLVYRVFGISC